MVHVLAWCPECKTCRLSKLRVRQGKSWTTTNDFQPVQALEAEATLADEQIQKGGLLDEAPSSIKDQLEALKSAFGLQ